MSKLMFNAFLSLFIISTSSFGQTKIPFQSLINTEVAPTQSFVVSGVLEASEKASNELVLKARENAQDYSARNSTSSSTGSSGSSSPSGGSSKTASVASIRNETYDNAGRKTEGYWVKCSSGRETRVYRTAWDSNRSWYKPSFPNGDYLASGNTSIHDVAQSLCK